MSSKDKGLKYFLDIRNYSSELLEKSDLSGVTIKDILGFEVSRAANAFLPHAKCVPITTLLPLYDTLTVGISKAKKLSEIQDQTGLAFEDIVTLAHKKRLVLFINVDCPRCIKDMSGVVNAFLDNDVPLFFSGPQETLLALKAAETVGVDYKDRNWKNIVLEYSLLVESPKTKKLREKLTMIDKRLREMHRPGIRFHDPEIGISDTWGYPFIVESTYPVDICSRIRPTAEYLREVIEVGRKGGSRKYVRALAERLYMVPWFLMAKALVSALCTNVGCRYLYGIEERPGSPFRSFRQPDYFEPEKLQFVEKKLRIAYSDDIPLAEYAEVFDSRTSRALRNIVKTIMSKSTGLGTSFIPMQNLVSEYNEAVNELISRKTRKAKIVYATSDILKSNLEAIKILMVGVLEKYMNVPQKAWDCIALPKRYRRSVLQWLKEKAVGLESKLVGVSPDIIHLYHTRTCLERLKKAS